MKTLQLSTLKVNASTSKAISLFIYENRNELSNEMKLFYSDVRSMIDRETKKKTSLRVSMNEILERAYNIEIYVLNSGAASYEVVFA